MALQRREPYECRRARGGGGRGAFPSSAQTDKKTTKKKKSVVKTLTSRPLLLISLPRLPPQRHPMALHLPMCLSLFERVCLCGGCCRIQVKPVRQLRQMWLLVPSLKKEEPRWRVGPHRRSRLPVTWPWPPGSSVVCGRWTRPVKTGRSRRWCWSR